MKGEAIGKLLKIASNQIVTNFDNYTKKFGLTGNQLLLIDYLYDKRDSNVCPRDIEKMLVVKRSTVSILLNRMEEHGLIQKEPDEKDARLKHIVLTDKALQIRSKTKDYLSLESEHLHSIMSDKEIEEFTKLLNKIIHGGTTDYGKC